MKNPLLFLLLLLVFSCKKEESKPAPIERTESFTLSKISVVPLEILILTLEKATDEKSLELKLGSSAITAKQIHGDQYGFMVPETISQGTYELKLKDGLKKVTVTVRNSPAISNPAAYIDEFVGLAATQFATLAKIEDTLVKQGLLTTSIALEERRTLNEKRQTFAAQVQALSENDKLKLARAISANRAPIDSLHSEIQSLIATQIPMKGRVMANCPTFPLDDYNDCVARKTAMLFVRVMIEAVIVYGAFTVPVYGIPLGTALAIVFFQDVQLLYRWTLNFLNRLAISSDPPELSFDDNTSPANEFKAGTNRLVIFRILLVNIYKGVDKKLASVDIQKFIESAESFNLFMTEKFKDLFTVKFEFPALRKGKRLPEIVDRLKVTVLNNPKVIGVISDFENGLFNLKFTSTEKKDQVFDYKISYQYAGKAVEKTIVNNKLLAGAGGVDLSDCTIKTSDGIPIDKTGEIDKTYKFSLEGTCKFPPKTLFFWDFGDGGTDESVDSQTANHKFTKSGDFTVKVRVLMEGGADYVNREVKVKIGVSDDTGPEYFTYKMNGKVFSSSDPRTHYVTSPINQGLFIDPLNYLVGYKVVEGRGWDDDHLWIKIGVRADQNLVQGSYPLTKPEKGKPALGVVMIGIISNNIFADSGTLTVTRRDNSWIEGNFSFNAGSFAITEGKFRIKLI